MLFKRFAVITLALLMAGCGGGDSGNPADPDKANPDITNPETVTPAPATGKGDTSELEGKWIKPCGPVDSSDSENNLYDVVTHVFSSDYKLTSELKNYTDSSCTTPFSYAAVAQADLTFSVGEALTTSDGLSAREIDTLVVKTSGSANVEWKKKDYTIYHISDSGILYLGDDVSDSDGTTAALRSTKLDFNRGYTKQAATD